jgi:hypothetical protein
VNHGAQEHKPAHHLQEQLLRCQDLYFCTSKSSKLSSKLSEYLEALLAVLDAGGLLACGSIEVQLEVQR